MPNIKQIMQKQNLEVRSCKTINYEQRNKKVSFLKLQYFMGKNLAFDFQSSKRYHTNICFILYLKTSRLIQHFCKIFLLILGAAAMKTVAVQSMHSNFN